MGCGASVSTAATNHSGTQQNGNLKISKVPVTITKTSLKGDYSQFQLAKYQREKQQKERQQRLYIAADELSGKVLEERERLSLGTRSRATSRNTSRTTSPTTNKRNAQNREEHTVPMTPVIEDRNRSESYRSEDSPNRHSMGAANPPESQESKKKTKHKTKKWSHKGEKNKSKSKKKSHKKPKHKRTISVESDEHDSGLEDSPHNNDSSDGVQSVDQVIKQGIVDDSEEMNTDNCENSFAKHQEGGDLSKNEAERKDLVDGMNDSTKEINGNSIEDTNYNQSEKDKVLNDNESDSKHEKQLLTENYITGDNQVVTDEQTETVEGEYTVKKVRFEETNATDKKGSTVS